MAIPASHIVEVLPRVITGGSANLELNGLLLSKSPLISTDSLALSFPSVASVGAYFGIDSDEYRAADVYFTSYNNRFVSPRTFFVARRIDADVAGWLRSAKYAGTLAALQAITDGGMVITVDGTAITVSAVDFSTATSFSDVATALQAKITGSTVTYSSLNGTFTITSGTTGADSSVSYASAPTTGTDLAALLGFSQEKGAVISSGMAEMTEAANMAAILTKTQNFVSFTTAWEAEADEMLEWANWASANYGWLYVPYTTDPNTVSQDSSIDPASALKAAGYDHTAIVYGGIDYAAFIMGIVASVAWQRVNGTITAAFKRQSGLAGIVVDETTAAILESKNCNYMGNFATRNAEFVFLYPGCLSASDYGFIDPYINSIWFNARLQVALMDGLTSVGRVPYNVRGYTLLKAWMQDPISEALNNASIEPGVVLSEKQKTEVANEAGLDISQELFTAGYYVQVLDPGASVRAERGSPIVSIWYCYGGAVQRLEVASTAVL